MRIHRSIYIYIRTMNRINSYQLGSSINYTLLYGNYYQCNYENDSILQFFSCIVFCTEQLRFYNKNNLLSSEKGLFIVSKCFTMYRNRLLKNTLSKNNSNGIDNSILEWFWIVVQEHSFLCILKLNINAFGVTEGTLAHRKYFVFLVVSRIKSINSWVQILNKIFMNILNSRSFGHKINK